MLHHAKLIVVLTVKFFRLFASDMVEANVNAEGTVTDVDFSDFQPGSVIAFRYFSVSLLNKSRKPL